MAYLANLEEDAFYALLKEFWARNGLDLAAVLPFTRAKTPVINLFMLERVVRRLGGPAICSELDLWEAIVECVVDSRLLPDPDYADYLVPTIQSLYEKVLLPFVQSNSA
mmetsp:Transcript_25559/g.42053  ORF Transcript_25559/g.42053 Transcript_25559/m.42053 type:complete len:109 (-) Transcript_25559:837-1163(-)